jgi:hypothetical protein
VPVGRRHAAGQPAQQANQILPYPLNERKIEVLQLIATRPRIRETATELVVTLKHSEDPYQQHLRQIRRQQPRPGRLTGQRAKPAALTKLGPNLPLNIPISSH